MTLHRWLFEGQPDATNASQPNVVSTPAGLTAVTVSPGAGGGVIQFSTAQVHNGLTSMRFQGGGTNPAQMRVPYNASNLQVAFTIYHRAASLPPSNMVIGGPLSGTATQAALIQVNTDGSVSVLANGGAVIASTAASAWVANRWNRIAAVMTVATSTTGVMTLNVYDGDNTTPTGTISFSNGNLGTAVITRYEMGTPNNGTNTWQHWYDSVQLNDGASTEIPAYVTTTPELVTAQIRR